MLLTDGGGITNGSRLVTVISLPSFGESRMDERFHGLVEVAGRRRLPVVKDTSQAPLSLLDPFWVLLE